jgi:hypothetical protein
MRAWARRTSELHDELAAIAEPDVRWWLVAGGAAATELRAPRAAYVISDAEPGADTFIGYRAPRPTDPFLDAIARAKAARQALRELDGSFPEQPLAVTVDRSAAAVIAPSALDVAAFAIGDRVFAHRLDDPQLADKLRRGEPSPSGLSVPFVCVSIGVDPIEVARHAHRRAWSDRGGPWLGLGRAARQPPTVDIDRQPADIGRQLDFADIRASRPDNELATVSTCHFVVDGYGHARLAARIAELTREVPDAYGASQAHGSNGHASNQHGSNGQALPRLGPVAGAIPLGVAWRELPYPPPRAIPMAYALGRVLHHRSGMNGDARFSPTFQIPVAPGDRADTTRWRRRVVPALASVRFDETGQPEPFDVFEARVRDAIAREAQGRGLCSRLLAAARAAPAPLAWKRKSASPSRPKWLDRFADVIGGRGCLSRIHVDAAMPAACAVSSPARLATDDDLLGGCVITVLDDGTRAALTVCGSGRLGEAEAVLDELVALLEA